MNRTKAGRKTLQESCAWIRAHWNATNLDVPEDLREKWMYEPSDERSVPEGFHLAVFTFGFVQHDMVSHCVPGGVRRQYSSEMLLSRFTHWQLKLALAEVHTRTNLKTQALPLFEFQENEKVEVWCDMA
jgi:hypothetical protein